MEREQQKRKEKKRKTIKNAFSNMKNYKERTDYDILKRQCMCIYFEFNTVSIINHSFFNS